MEAEVLVQSDATAAKGGEGAPHTQTRHLWLQGRVAMNPLKVDHVHVPGKRIESDVLTRIVSMAQGSCSQYMSEGQMSFSDS